MHDTGTMTAEQGPRRVGQWSGRVEREQGVDVQHEEQRHLKKEMLDSEARQLF